MAFISWADPFTLGVASGDPTSTGVVIWTRLAPRPLEPEGGLPRENIEVGWELASDEAMKNVVRRGTAVGHAAARPTPSTSRSTASTPTAGTGTASMPATPRARSAARARCRADSASPEQLRFAFASCQHYEQGLFTAYEHMAEDDLDLVFHLGDYIYEYAGTERRVRKHVGAETQTLDDYRIRYAQYRTDPPSSGCTPVARGS